MTLSQPTTDIRVRTRAALTQAAPTVSPLVTWTLANLDHVDPLTTAERLVLTTIALHAEIDLRTGDGYTGHALGTIAGITGLSVDRAGRTERALLKRGLLVRSVVHPAKVRLPDEAFNH